MEKLLIFNICETYSGVMWSSCKRSNATQLNLVSDVKLNSTLSYFTQTEAAYDENTEVKLQQT